MGAGIAEAAAKAGFDVIVRSRSQESADRCHAKIGKSLGRQVEKGKLPAADAEAILGRIKAVTDLAELEYCELVLESVVEDLGTKKQLFSELDAACAAYRDTILAWPILQEWIRDAAAEPDDVAELDVEF